MSQQDHTTENLPKGEVLPMSPLDAETHNAMDKVLDKSSEAPVLDLDAEAVRAAEVIQAQSSPRNSDLTKKKGLFGWLKGDAPKRPGKGKKAAAPLHVTMAAPGSTADDAAGVDMMKNLFEQANGSTSQSGTVVEAQRVEPELEDAIATAAQGQGARKLEKPVVHAAYVEESPTPADEQQLKQEAPLVVKSVQADEPKAKKRGMGALFKKKEVEVTKAAKPIAVIFGFLPNVREQDAREYALGYAAEFMQTHGMVYFEAFPYKEGFAFEVQQGGEGRAYLPEILKFFDEHGTFEAGENVSVIVDTATRKAEVYRTRDGLDFVLLPEGAEKVPTEWLKGSHTMTPTVNRKTGFFVTGAVIFATGFAGLMVSSMLTRYQSYEPPPIPTVEYVLLKETPMGQWDALQSVPKNSYVKALRFRNGKWEPPEVVVDVEMMRMETAQAEAAAALDLPAPASPVADAPSAAPTPAASVATPAAAPAPSQAASAAKPHSALGNAKAKKEQTK